MSRVSLLVIVTLSLAPVFVLASFDANLGYGSSGSEVTALQEFLKTQEAYDGPVTGNFYSLTLAGVKAFQAREGIYPVSGFFGPLTRARANELLSVSAAPALEAASPSASSINPVKQLADLLKQVIALQDKVKQLQEQSTSPQTEQQETVQEPSQPSQTTPAAPNPNAQKISELKGVIDSIIQLVQAWDASQGNYLCFVSSEYDKWQNYSYSYAVQNTISAPNIPTFNRSTQCTDAELVSYKGQLQTIRDGLQ